MKHKFITNKMALTFNFFEYNNFSLMYVFRTVRIVNNNITVWKKSVMFSYVIFQTLESFISAIIIHEFYHKSYLRLNKLFISININ